MTLWRWSSQVLAAGALALSSCVQASTPAAPSSATSNQSAPQAAPRDQEPAAAEQPQEPAKAAADLRINDLLDRLERSAEQLTSFTADVVYEKEDAILGRKEVRIGSVIYRADAQADRKEFAILLEYQITGNVRRNDPKHYVFNGRWLAEINHAAKEFIKREVVPPGRKLDPLKLGEGPFPLPVGQPKAEVLSRFDVSEAPKPEAGLLKDLSEVEAVRLTPKPGTAEAKEYERIDLYYASDTLLPAGIDMVAENGDRKTIRLRNAVLNPQLDEDATKKLDITEPDPREWRISVQPWSAGGGT